MLENLKGIGGVLEGERALQIEAKIPEEQLQKLAVYLFGAVFVAMLLANMLVKR